MKFFVVNRCFEMYECKKCDWRISYMFWADFQHLLMLIFFREFNSDAESVVICDTPAYEEEFTPSSDSSHIMKE